MYVEGLPRSGVYAVKERGATGDYIRTTLRLIFIRPAVVLKLIVHCVGEGKALINVVWTERFADTVTLHIVVITVHWEWRIPVDFAVSQFITSLIIGGVLVVLVPLIFEEFVDVLDHRIFPPGSPEVQAQFIYQSFITLRHDN